MSLISKAMLESMAARCGLPLEEVLALPDAIPRMSKAEHRDNLRAAIMARSRIPALICTVIADKALLRPTEPLRHAKAWGAGNAWGLVLGGSRGTGKSVAACSALVEAGGGMFCTAVEIADRQTGAEVAVRAKATSFLVLDDLGEEGGWDEALVRIREVLTGRERENRRTIVTTNLNRRGTDECPLGFVERYGERLNDRIGAQYYGCGGPSLRSSR